MDIKELMPQKSEYPLSGINTERIKSVHKPMQDAVFIVEKAYSHIVSDFQKDRIKRFMCSKPLLDAEIAIEKQYQLALSGDENAAQKVASGMQYWQKLVLREIDKYLEVSGR